MRSATSCLASERGRTSNFCRCSGEHPDFLASLKRELCMSVEQDLSEVVRSHQCHATTGDAALANQAGREGKLLRKELNLCQIASFGR